MTARKSTEPTENRKFARLITDDAPASVAIGVFFDHPPPLVRQLANQPVGLDRVVKPRLDPALLETASDDRTADLLPIRIKKRQFSAGLIAPEPEITKLRRSG